MYILLVFRAKSNTVQYVIKHVSVDMCHTSFSMFFSVRKPQLLASTWAPCSATVITSLGSAEGTFWLNIKAALDVVKKQNKKNGRYFFTYCLLEYLGEQSRIYMHKYSVVIGIK